MTSIDRRRLLQLTGAGVAAAAVVSATANSSFAQTTAEWDKTFPLSTDVEHSKVNFTNRYGIRLVGDLYLPRNRGSAALPALAVAGPFGAVKEQSAGLYAQTMAERGFVTLAFDPSFVGESGGEPRQVASPDINAEDFMAAIDFLGLQAGVDRNRLGVIGICGFAGMALNAVAADKRVKAVATTSMYDMSRVMAKGYYDAMKPEDRTATLQTISEQRWADVEAGKPSLAVQSRHLVDWV